MSEPAERAWLLHELGKCYFELEEHEDALDHGERALAYAQEAQDPDTELNVRVLVGNASGERGLG